MKKQILMVMTGLVLSGSAFAACPGDLVGTYRAISPSLGNDAIMTVTTNGSNVSITSLGGTEFRNAYIYSGKLGSVSSTADDSSNPGGKLTQLISCKGNILELELTELDAKGGKLVDTIFDYSLDDAKKVLKSEMPNSGIAPDTFGRVVQSAN